MSWRRLARTLNPSRTLVRGLAEGGRGTSPSTSGRSFEEAAAAAAAPAPAGRLRLDVTWLEAAAAPLRRPVRLDQGTLALLLLGSVALGGALPAGAWPGLGERR